MADRNGLLIFSDDGNALAVAKTDTQVTTTPQTRGEGNDTATEGRVTEDAAGLRSSGQAGDQATTEAADGQPEQRLSDITAEDFGRLNEPEFMRESLTHKGWGVVTAKTDSPAFVTSKEEGPLKGALIQRHEDRVASDQARLKAELEASGVPYIEVYRSEEMEAKLCAQNMKSHIHRKGTRGKPLTEQAKGSNRTKSTVRIRVEHVFGAQTNDMGGTLVRTIGLVRAKAKIGMKNLAYNMRRLCQLRRINPVQARDDVQRISRHVPHC